MKKDVRNLSTLQIGFFPFRFRGLLASIPFCGRLITLSRCWRLESTHFPAEHLLTKTYWSIQFHISWRSSHDHFFIAYCRNTFLNFFFRFLNSWRRSYPLLLTLCNFCRFHRCTFIVRATLESIDGWWYYMKVSYFIIMMLAIMGLV